MRISRYIFVPALFLHPPCHCPHILYHHLCKFNGCVVFQLKCHPYKKPQIVPFYGWDSVLTSFMTFTHSATFCSCVSTCSYPQLNQELLEDRVHSNLLCLCIQSHSVLCLAWRGPQWMSIDWFKWINGERKCFQETSARKGESKTTASLWIAVM